MTIVKTILRTVWSIMSIISLEKIIAKPYSLNPSPVHVATSCPRHLVTRNRGEEQTLSSVDGALVTSPSFVDTRFVSLVF